MKRWILAAAVLLVAFNAWGYLLSANVILKKMAEQRDGLELTSLIAHGTFSFRGEEGQRVREALALPEGGERAVGGRVIYKMPGKCRVELDAVPGKEPISVTNAGGPLKKTGADIGSLALFSANVCPLLDRRGGEDGPVGMVREAKIDRETVAFGRIGGTVAYVIGARARDVGVPSLWVGKERFEPLRLVVRDPAGGVLDIRMSDYSSAAAGEWHPRVVEIRKGEESVARFSVERVEANAKIPSVIF